MHRVVGMYSGKVGNRGLGSVGGEGTAYGFKGNWAPQFKVLNGDFIENGRSVNQGKGGRKKKRGGGTGGLQGQDIRRVGEEGDGASG